MAFNRPLDHMGKMCLINVCVMCYNVVGISISVVSLINTRARQTFHKKASLSSDIQSMVNMGLRQEER